MERINIEIRKINKKWFIIEIYKGSRLEQEHLVTAEQLKFLIESLPK